jgi:two-component system sensor histidine kinase KdpD
LKQSRVALQRHPVDVKIPDNIPPIKMDVERISEVLVHLLENASKYSPPETPIHVVVELRLGGEVVTSVADHGPGIDDIELDMIFEKFYRGRSLRSRIQGTGMGLAIAKAIIELHGGTIGVRSQVGRGSVFYFTLHTE